jgi:hypothetical protein
MRIFGVSVLPLILRLCVVNVIGITLCTDKEDAGHAVEFLLDKATGKARPVCRPLRTADGIGVR